MYVQELDAASAIAHQEQYQAKLKSTLAAVAQAVAPVASGDLASTRAQNEALKAELANLRALAAARATSGVSAAADSAAVVPTSEERVREMVRSSRFLPCRSFS